MVTKGTNAPASSGDTPPIHFCAMPTGARIAYSVIGEGAPLVWAAPWFNMGAAQAIARQFPWGEYTSVLDLGTAEGNLPVQVARTHPHVSGIGFDLPPLAPVFAEYVSAHDLEPRLRFHAGDFLKDPLPSADVVVMGMILHDWDLDEKRVLIAKAYATLPPGGALIVYDTVIDDDRRQHAFGLLMSLNMLIETLGGFDYTAADCIGWLTDAGFRETAVEPLTGPMSMVVGIK